MTTEMIIKLIRGLLPITLIIVTCIIIKKTTKKQFEGITPEPLAGMRYPTEEEANIIKNQVIPRERKKAIVLTLIFLPISIIVTGAFISNYQPGNLFATIAGSCLALGVWCMFIGMLSAPLTAISDIRKIRYQVSDCTIAGIDIRPTGKHRVETYFATVKDSRDNIWETALPKDLLSVSEGTRCLVLIYDAEERINRNRKDGMPIYRREVIVTDMYM